MKKKIRIGLDMGIALVGWAVVDNDKFDILAAGSRLFPEAGTSSGASAEDRRIKRSSRRRQRRQKLRVEDFNKLLRKHNYSEFYINVKISNLILLRNQALTEKISQEEFLKF